MSNPPWMDPTYLVSDVMARATQRLRVEQQLRERQEAVAARSRMNRSQRRAAERQQAEAEANQ